jgi:hypothetical protein
MEHFEFFAIIFAIWLVVLIIDRKRIRDHALLSAIGLVAALIFENATIFLGLWIYNSEPKIVFLSLFTWLLYAPYLSFCYFIGSKIKA